VPPWFDPASTGTFVVTYVSLSREIRWACNGALSGLAYFRDRLKPVLRVGLAAPGSIHPLR